VTPDRPQLPQVVASTPDATLLSQLDRHATERASEPAMTFLDDGEHSVQVLSYGQLHRAAQRLARALLGTLAPGSRVLLAFRSGPEFVEAFLGCLYAGMIPVPVYPPRPREDARRLDGIVRNARPALALCHDDVIAIGKALATQDGAWTFPWRSPAKIVSSAPVARRRLPQRTPSDVAFLQYTSGSTSAPRGVVVTHANLVATFEAMRTPMGITPQSVFLSWLPLNHDMGLIGMVLQALFVGCRLILMSPAHFLQRPIRWLSAISRYRATHSGGPNFAFDLCVRRVTPEQIADLDLRSWMLAFNAAEPVRPTTMDAFIEAFAPAGFRPEAMSPTYGMAECTLYTCSGPLGRRAPIEAFEADELSAGHARLGPRAATRLPAHGVAPSGHELVIADPQEGRRLSNGEVGEIWFRGPSVAAGYWDNPAATQAAFEGRTTEGAGPYLRTGDAGFLWGGELYITGRLKDLIIVRGLNVHPQDIELTAEQAHEALLPAGGAAFAHPSAPDSFIHVHEVKRQRAGDLHALARMLASALLEAHGVRPRRVVFIRPGGLPKTSSGKVQRQATARALDSTSLPILADVSGLELTAPPPALRKAKSSIKDVMHHAE
jgi:acyl-CoA synthetase (AMP-forming)/AMP-acid ligase II